MYLIRESIVVMKQIYFETLLDLPIFSTLYVNKWFCNAAYLPACLSMSVCLCVRVCVCIYMYA
jgi:hypothetical protein